MSSDSSLPASPRITHLAWGELAIEGRDAPFKDAKLYPGGARAWDWNETGTRHRPGIQVADVEELVEYGAKVVVLSKGVNERLRVKQETLDWLAERGVESHVLQTEAAAERYNALRKEVAVGGLFHSTC